MVKIVNQWYISVLYRIVRFEYCSDLPQCEHIHVAPETKTAVLYFFHLLIVNIGKCP